MAFVPYSAFYFGRGDGIGEETDNSENLRNLETTLHSTTRMPSSRAYAYGRSRETLSNWNRALTYHGSQRARDWCCSSSDIPPLPLASRRSSITSSQYAVAHVQASIASSQAHNYVNSKSHISRPWGCHGSNGSSVPGPMHQACLVTPWSILC